MIGWCERWTAGAGASSLADFLERARALRDAGFDVSLLVAPDKSHVVMAVCDVDALTVAAPQVAWIERDGQLPLEAA